MLNECENYTKQLNEISCIIKHGYKNKIGYFYNFFTAKWVPLLRIHKMWDSDIAPETHSPE